MTWTWLIGALSRPVGDWLLGAALHGMDLVLDLALALGWPVP
jgi:hypothetical protein